ncbi:peptidase inhibitor family I36 protein [Amycolatopsis sp. DG1A-15b]|uniref:peptidase inhibitor family I36 protein n=1 Tax=Amycolatopsis sp. DG1A-15b TaxID=3052846 RepID=UPI00255B5262|nr:peptidase inhibitor family I36 protein [Amycolatopsis sp. DG1A-15b]WIX90426.1 peptidase inhibitor family I36 protein [Amycolatopsis sp. DG1A-15b]
MNGTSKKRGWARLAGVAALGLLGSLTVATGSAAAATGSGAFGPDSFSDCPLNRICVYAATNGGTSPGWASYTATSPGRCTNAPIATLAGVRGALSVYNRTGRVQRVYAAFDCGGDPRVVNVNTAIPNLGAAHWSIGG